MTSIDQRPGTLVGPHRQLNHDGYIDHYEIRYEDVSNRPDCSTCNALNKLCTGAFRPGRALRAQVGEIKKENLELLQKQAEQGKTNCHPRIESTPS